MIHKNTFNFLMPLLLILLGLNSSYAFQLRVFNNSSKTYTIKESNTPGPNWFNYHFNSHTVEGHTMQTMFDLEILNGASLNDSIQFYIYPTASAPANLSSGATLTVTVKRVIAMQEMGSDYLPDNFFGAVGDFTLSNNNLTNPIKLFYSPRPITASHPQQYSNSIPLINLCIPNDQGKFPLFPECATLSSTAQSINAFITDPSDTGSHDNAFALNTVLITS